MSDVLQKHLNRQQKKWFLEILNRANKVKRSQQNSDKIMLKSLTSINKNSSNPVTFNEMSKNTSPKLSGNQLYRSSNGSKQLDDEYVFQHNVQSANEGSGALMKKFELTGPTIGKRSSEEEMIYQGAPSRRNELLQSGMVLMQSITPCDRTPK